MLDKYESPRTLTGAQAAADSVYSLLGESAPQAMAGETVQAYRVRLVRGLQPHCKAFANSDLAALARADSIAFNAIERDILEDVRNFARTPMAVPDGQLREIVTTSSGGHRISTFVGDPFAWLGRHIQRPMRVRFNTRPSSG